MAYRLGVDVGGTFTDLMLVDDSTGKNWQVKTPSTPADPSQGVLGGISRILTESDVPAGKIASIVHGTTVATNAVLEGKGAKVGLITTRGFKQILHLARSQTPGPLAGWMIMIKSDPPAALEHTREADERMNAQGKTVTKVGERQIRKIVKELIAEDIESLTVSLINSYANPAHERQIRKIVRSIDKSLPVTLSSDVLPEFREYERTVTACMNSYVQPKVGGYIRNLEKAIGKLGVKCDINILRSDAGLMSTKVTREKPVYAILSGPSGGVAGALDVSKRAGFPNILTFDMGGTSTDVALCEGGEPTIARETELGQFRVKVPSVNVHSVGAGGGSLAHVPELTKALRVGPESGGADPGPACYGKGGKVLEGTEHVAPAVTDANVVVGHLPPQLIGGEMELDVKAARSAVRNVGKPLGLTVEKAAKGIIDIVNENMAGALRLVSVQRGYDPRDFALVAFGGAGPLHANAVAEIMGSFPVLVPPGPGLLCAQGDLVADFREEFSQTLIRPLEQVSAKQILTILEKEGKAALAWMKREKVPKNRQRLSYTIDLRYYRQGYEIPIDVTPAEIKKRGTDWLAKKFGEMHEQYYGFQMDGTPCEVVNLRAIGIGKVPEPVVKASRKTTRKVSSAVLRKDHRIYSNGKWKDVAIYDRSKLGPGHKVKGPAVITEFDSTTLVLEGYTAEIDSYLNILINPNRRAAKKATKKKAAKKKVTRKKTAKKTGRRS